MKKIILIVLFFNFIICSGQPPIASFPFNGNSNDVTGNGHDGTNYNLTLTNDRFGISNSAYSFNGINSYINIGNSFTFTSHTFSAWINLNSYPVSSQEFMVILSSIQNGNYTGYGTEFRANIDSTTDIAIGNGITFYGFSTPWLLPTVTTNSWQHVVFKYDHSISRGYMYLNTILIDSVDVVGGYQSIPSNPFFIGARPSYGSTLTPPDTTYFFMDGIIDDINIFDRPISEFEIDSLYNYDPFTVVNDNIENRYLIYPNPVNDLVKIESNSIIENITISNINGTFTFFTDTPLINSVLLNVSNLEKGLYLLKVNNSDYKLVKN